MYLLEVPHQIINKLLIPFDIGLLVFFSLSFILLQVLVSVGMTYLQIRREKKKSDKDIIRLCKDFFEIVDLNCKKLIKNILSIWQCALNQY